MFQQTSIFSYRYNKKKRIKESMGDKKNLFFIMRIIRIDSQPLSYIAHSRISYSHHVVHYTPSTYLSYNWPPFSNSYFPHFLPMVTRRVRSLFFCLVLFFLFFFFFFKILHISEIIVFLQWLISLGIMPSRSIHVVTNDKVYSFLKFEWCFICMNIHHNFFIWTLRLSSCLGCCKLCCCEHGDVDIFLI